MLFLCRWPNGDFSVVKASNKDEAIELLDEVGNAEGSPVTPIKAFMVHFALTDDGELELEGWGEETRDLVMELGYPILDKARSGALDKSDEERAAIIRRAVAKERERIVEKKVNKPKTIVGQNIKAMADVPTKKIDRIVEREAAKALSNFKGKGKAN
jgi:hypothetical protein